MTKPMRTTVRDTLSSSREVIKTSQYNDSGVANVSMTTRQLEPNLRRFEAAVDNARRAVLGSLKTQGYEATVRSEFVRAEKTSEGYLVEIKTMAKAVI